MAKCRARSAVLSELDRLNPWIHTTGHGGDLAQIARALWADVGPLSAKARFEQALATRARWRMGMRAWNAWAQDMIWLEAETRDDPASNAITIALSRVTFSGLRFDHHADFAGFVFPGDVDFSGAEIEAPGWFQTVQVHGYADFTAARFGQQMSFDGAVLHGDLDMTRAHMTEGAEFRTVAIHGAARFDHAVFSGPVWFTDARFHHDASFRDIEFHEAAGFAGVHWQGETDFSGAAFRDGFSFERCRFERAVDLTRIVTQGAAWFRSAEFMVPPKANGRHVRDVLAGAGAPTDSDA